MRTAGRLEGQREHRASKARRIESSQLAARMCRNNGHQIVGALLMARNIQHWSADDDLLVSTHRSNSKLRLTPWRGGGNDGRTILHPRTCHRSEVANRPRHPRVRKPHQDRSAGYFTAGTAVIPDDISPGTRREGSIGPVRPLYNTEEAQHESDR